MSPRPPVLFLSALVAAASVGLATTAGGSPAESCSLSRMASSHAHAVDTIEPTTPRLAGGLRVDRLSPKQLERWRPIVRLVFAEDDRGRPLHPTLRSLWDEVAASGHEVYVELPEPTLPVRNTAGLFRIETVHASGHIVATLQLNLQTIDRAKVRTAAQHGFCRFYGLERERRYAEVLGHELGHAVWALADASRARHQLALGTRQVELARSLLAAERDARALIGSRMRELAVQAEALETPGLAAEARVWRELSASQAARSR